MAAVPFVHLHCHTEYSLLDGAIRTKDLVAKAAAFGMPAVALTDHGNLYGAIEFYLAAERAGIRPIIGCEAYVAPNSLRERNASTETRPVSRHNAAVVPGGYGDGVYRAGARLYALP